MHACATLDTHDVLGILANTNFMLILFAGTMVWGKLPGYDWWPGVLLSYSDGIKKEAEELSDDEGDGSAVVRVWVKWYGDNQLSQVRNEGEREKEREEEREGGRKRGRKRGREGGRREQTSIILMMCSSLLWYSQIPVTRLAPFEQFKENYRSLQMKGVYKRAVLAAIKVRCLLQLLTVEILVGPKLEYCL